MKTTERHVPKRDQQEPARSFAHGLLRHGPQIIVGTLMPGGAALLCLTVPLR